MEHRRQGQLDDPAAAVSRLAAPLQPVFEKSLRTARAILRQLPLLCLATLLSLIYLCSRGIRSAFGLFGRWASRPPVERAALLGAVVVLGAGALWLTLPGNTELAADAIPVADTVPMAEPAPPPAQRYAAPAAPHPVHSEAAELAEEDKKAAAEGVTLTVTLAEAVAHQIGESLSFFELGGKINEIFTPLKKGDTNTAMSKGAGAVTEYSLAAWLVDSLEIMALIASGAALEAALGVAGSVAHGRSSVFVGEQVEEKTHESLSGGHGGGHAPESSHGEQTALK